MPTLTTRIPANKPPAAPAAAAVTSAMAAPSAGLAATAGATVGAAVSAANSNAAATCTFSGNSDYLQQSHQQQQRQQQQQQQHLQQLHLQQHQLQPPQLNHHYHPHQQMHQQHQNSPPPLPPPHPHLDGTGSGSGSVTFNGNCSASIAAGGSISAANPNVSNGNIANIPGVAHSNGNGNIMSATFSTTAPTTANANDIASPVAGINQVNQQQQLQQQLQQQQMETSSNAGSSSLNGSIKKSSMHASREDVASLGGGSSINSQSTANATHNNINNNSIIKGTKDNFYIGVGGGGSSRNTDHDDDDGLGPLPPKWETAYTERGELYFIDHNTGTSHWLDPRLSKFQKKSLEDCSDNELPYGWEKIEDSLYGTYYIDHVNRRTQYENPVLEAKRRAAEQRKQLKPPPPQPGAVDSAIGRANNTGALDSNGLPSASELQQRGPPPPPVGAEKSLLLPYKFTRNPAEMQGERITTTLLKSARGLGITIVGGDDNVEEFLQIKSIVPNGPAWLDGQLQMGDILVYVNDTCVLGFTHHEMVNVFQSIHPGETVTLEVCRGYPLPFDPNDPNTEVVTTIAVDGITSEPEKQRMLMDLNMDGNYNFLDVSGGDGANGSAEASQKNTPHASESPGDFILMKKPEVLTFSIVKGVMGFGFTIADSAYGQKVKKILDRNCCKNLQEGDILLEINNVTVRNKSHIEVVQVLKDCSKTEPTTVKIQRGSNFNSASLGGGATGNVSKLRKNFIGNGLFRSKTPTADLYSTQQKEILPIRPKTPLVDTRRARVQTPNNELNDEVAAATNGIASPLDRSLAESKSQVDGKSTNSLQEIDAINQEIPFMDPYPKLVTSLSERLAEATLMNDTIGSQQGSHPGGGGYVNSSSHGNYDNQEYVPSSSSGGYNPIYGMSTMPPTMSPLNPPVHHSTHHLSSAQSNSALYSPAMNMMNPVPTYHHESCYCYECQDYQRYKFRQQQQHPQLQMPSQQNFYPMHHQQQQQQSSPMLPLSHHHQQSQYSPLQPTPLQAAHIQNERMQKRVNELLHDRRKVGFSPLDHPIAAGYLPVSQQHSPAAASNISQSALQQQSQANWNYNMGMGGGLAQLVNGGMQVGGAVTPSMRPMLDDDEQFELSEVTLERQALGFGFRIVGGTEEGSQVTVGHIVPGGAADNDHRIATGDEILSIDGINVVNSSHHKVVSLMGEAALRGQVTMILRRRVRHMAPLQGGLRSMRYPYDVIVSRHENEGFGFVIISSSNQYYGSTIGKLIPGSPADRCGDLKVGDRIIAVNRIEIAGMSHGDVVQLIKESGLHVRLTIGCPKEGNPLLNSAQASPGQLSQTQQSVSSSASATAVLQSSLLQTTTVQPPQPQHPAINKSETPTYFERTTQLNQHPQL